MAAKDQKPALIELPSLPVKHTDWIQHISTHSGKPLRELVGPYKEYDAKLREVFAQQPEHPAIDTPNVVPVFAGHEHELKVRARNLANESEAERQSYLMPLSKTERKPSGQPAVVPSLAEFQTNFQLFSESSLVDLDWSNVVAAGSAVVTALLPVSKEHSSSKRALRGYYHQQLAPASDVDLFLYGLTEEQAVEKIKQIEQRIKDSILTETTTIRTKNAITIASHYPTRHVQIVLRIYRSISEILTGFDVDCSCAAYDGKQVYASPRALVAFMTQINTIDLTRRSPSYENRLSKYARRGFEVHWPLLNRSRIDPTLFERSFGRTLGLARLLVLEKLPKNSDREAYLDERRAERGRPAVHRQYRRKLWGNVKEEHEEDVAEWVDTDEVSDYHTFTIPYGPKYHARKIERLLYAKDLLLNAEWNRPKERGTTLHRHPAFFGNATDVIGDCCGYCPEPATAEDEEIAAEESKIYVSGALSFIKDDPGRQAIGSFHPLTDDDWTEMAYVGNTARLCNAIVECDLEHVQDWLSQEGADPNQRDYTGRTPLHLAVMTSTPEIVQALIDAGARLVARLFDGKTALHLAAMHGEAEMVKALLTKSEANEEKEAEKEALKRKHQKHSKSNSGTGSANLEEKDNDDDSNDSFDEESENADATTEGSFIKIERKDSHNHEPLPEDTDDEPDIYDVNLVAWDAPVSALHLAIASGHVHVAKLLVQEFGADILLPVKLVNEHDKSPRAAILPVVLALHLSPEKAKEMTEVLLSLGASPAQGDPDHVTALTYFAAYGVDLLSTMISSNRPGAERAVNHLSLKGYRYRQDAKSILNTAIENEDQAAVNALLELGAKPEVDFASYVASVKSKTEMRGNTERNQQIFREYCEQPVFAAIRHDMPSTAQRLLEAGADVNSLAPKAWRAIKGIVYDTDDTGTVLDLVRHRIQALRTFMTIGKVDGVDGHMFSTGWVESLYSFQKRLPPIPLQEDSHYLHGCEPNTYAYWTVKEQIEQAKFEYQRDTKAYDVYLESRKLPKGTDEKKAAVEPLLKEFGALESHLLERNAKMFKELYPDLKLEERQVNHNFLQNPEPLKPWNPHLTFRAPDLTDERKTGYLKLFQACWEADLNTIKELTLAIWGNKQTPLEIAVKDSKDFSPFSIAVLRKHYGIARAVLEIAHAQYAPAETPAVKHKLRPEQEDDSSTDDGQDEIQIYAEIVDDRFTVENIGDVQNHLKSTVKPLEMISWFCPSFNFLCESNPSAELWLPSELFGSGNDRRDPKSEVAQPSNLFQFAIYLDDSNLLRFLLARCEEYLQHSSEGANETCKIFRFDEVDFLYAIRLGRVQLLEIIIGSTGAGLPLDDLIKKIDVEIPVRPKSYQGLSVHGKKRADWADAGRGVQQTAPEAQQPPLLHAAHLGNLKSVEWFLGDAALRCYSQFADDHRDNVRIQNLAKARGGVEASIMKWLDRHSHLLLHCVVMGPKSEESMYLLRHLCKIRPEALDHRSVQGMTPLHVAFALHRVDMVKILLEAGADQSTRNNARSNIVHSMLECYGNTKGDIDDMRQLLGLIDDRLASSLFTERTTKSPGAATPLGWWVNARLRWSGGSNSWYDCEVLRIILDCSKGEDLSIVNGDGDTPVHAAVRYGAHAILSIMLERRPELLFRENASGHTPFEMAEHYYLSKEIFNDPPSLLLPKQGRIQNRATGVLALTPESFIEDARDAGSNNEKLLQVCKEFAAAQGKGQKRRLVSLVEANEVAKRLALRTGNGVAGDEPFEQELAEEEEEEDDDKRDNTPHDEVSAWYRDSPRGSLAAAKPE